MVPDTHIHTPLCRHAEGAPADYRAAARRAGIPEIAFTDHLPNPDGYDPGNRMLPAHWPDYLELVREQQTPDPPGVRLGTESDYYEGCEESLRAYLAATPFDLVLGSVHHIRDWGFDNPGERQVWDSVDVTGAWKEYFALLGRLADQRLVDVIGHLDLPKKFGHRPPDRAVKEMAQPTLDRIAAAGLAIEINSSGLRRPVAEIYPSPLLLELAHEREIPICFGSDAHRPEEVGYRFQDSIALARAAGYRQAVRFARRQKIAYPLP